MESTPKTVCSRCVYDTTVPNISFDHKGVCNYCHTHDTLIQQFPAGKEGEALLQRTASAVRAAGKGKKFDCIVGVSGGCDSSYLLYYVAEVLRLRPLAVHFDNTWNGDMAVANMHKVADALGVPVEVYTVDAAEYDDIYKAFFAAGVPDIETPTDIGLAAVLNMVAEKHRLHYVFEGHSFRSEGISPLGWLYMDGKYVASVHDRFGTMKRRTYPNMTLPDQLRWMLLRRIRKIRPLWHLDYNKEEVKRFLHERFSWQWYGGHHLENKFTAVFHSYFMPRRYGIDTRLLGHAALVRSGNLTREDALNALTQPCYMEEGLLDYLTTRLGIGEAQLAAWMEQPRKTYRDYPTYKQTFERMRPFFWAMAKLNLIPYSFYMKYTRPDPLPGT